MQEKTGQSKAEFLKAVQKRVAQVAIGPSTLRGSKPGTIKRVRIYLTELTLSRFCAGGRFADELDAATQDLTRAARIKWGTARKCLNIFLRDAACNFFLRQKYALAAIAEELELPLDSKTAKELHRRQRKNCELPSWPGVKWLSAHESKQYQALARAIADERQIDRVDLDNDYWPSIR